MSSARMSRTLVSLARRRGRLPALVAALGVAAILVLVRTLSELLSFLALGGDEGFDSNQIVEYLPIALPFALGVFLGLWLIAPLADELTLPFVFTRGGLATAAGAILVVVAQLVIAVVEAVSPGQFDPAELAQDAVLGVLTGLSSFVNHLILALFASVLLWLWLRAHPRDYAVSGLIDEV